MARVFSPSQTAVFKTCPLKWWLQYQVKYVSKKYNQKEIAGAIGTAFSTFQEFIDGGAKQSLERAHTELEEELEKLRSTREIMESAIPYESTAHDRLDKFAALYISNPIIPSSWEMFDRERSFPEHGNSRIDSAYRTSFDKIGILDFKTRGRLQANQREKARREFGTSNQMYHYCWMATEVYGEDVDQFSILILTLEPKPFIDLWQYRVKPAAMETWIAGRKQDWADMEAIIAGNRTPSMATEHEDKFGKCQFYDICFKHSFDEDQISEDFMVRG